MMLRCHVIVFTKHDDGYTGGRAIIKCTRQHLLFNWFVAEVKLRRFSNLKIFCVQVSENDYRNCLI